MSAPPSAPVATPLELEQRVAIETPEQVVFSYSVAGVGSVRHRPGSHTELMRLNMLRSSGSISALTCSAGTSGWGWPSTPATRVARCSGVTRS